MDDIDCIAQIIAQTDLMKYYYPSYDFLMISLMRGINEDYIYIGVSEHNDPITTLWFQKNGAFHSFPYLHVIAVKESEQGYGYGRQLMDFFEKEIMREGSRKLLRTKAFLLVNEENQKAINMYDACGYKCIAELPGLYRKNITERLMMKVICRQV